MISNITNLHPIGDRVARGAALLDAREPGWDGRVDPDWLDIGLCSRCVLAQLFGNYGLGRHFLQLSGAAARQHGFRSAIDRDEDEALTTAWVATVDRRRLGSWSIGEVADA